MREFMRSFLTFLLCIAALILLCGCKFDTGYYSASSSPMVDTPPSPELMKYAEDLAYSWNSRAGARTWKTEIDDVRDSRPVHIVTEAVCPDRYHVLFSGADLVDSYYIGKTMYVKKGNAAWSKTTMPMPITHLNACRFTPDKIDGERIRLLAESLRGLDIAGPVLREIGGHSCREWNRKDPGQRVTYPMSSCFDVESHALVQSVNGTTKTLYYWNIPLEIKAPN